MEMPDKYFKQMLDQASTPYEPIFWDSARSFIAKEERKRKRRVFFWWLSSVAVLVGMGAITWAIFLKDAAFKHAGPYASGVPDLNPVQSIPSGNQAVDISSTNQEMLFEKHNDTALSTPSDSQISKPPKTISKEINSNAYSTMNRNAPTVYAGEISEQINITERRSEAGPLVPNNAQDHEKREEYYLEQDLVSDLPSENTPGLKSVKPVELPFYVEEKEKSLLVNGTYNLNPQVKVKKHQINGYLSSSAMLNPAWKNDQLFTLGFSVGGGMHYTYGGIWNLRTGLSYLHRWGTFDVMLDHPTPVYGFVKNDKGYTLVPTDAAYLDMPISLGYTFGKVQAGAGITVMRLLGAKGKVFSYEGTPAENDPGTLVYRSSQISSGWIETPGFKNWILNYQLYLEYPLSNRMHLGCRLDYISSGLVKENYQYYYQHETGSYEWKRASGLLENKYQWHIYIYYTL